MWTDHQIPEPAHPRVSRHTLVSLNAWGRKNGSGGRRMRIRDSGSADDVTYGQLPALDLDATALGFLPSDQRDLWREMKCLVRLTCHAMHTLGE